MTCTLQSMKRLAASQSLKTRLQRLGRDDVGNLNRALDLLFEEASKAVDVCPVAMANRELRELDKLKTNFVNAVSHELRTPLTSIVGYAEFLEDGLEGDLTPGQLEYVRQIQNNTERLQRLVEDLLDYARIEAGTFKLDVRPFNLGTLVLEEVTSLKPLAHQKGVELAIDTPNTVTVSGDSSRIGQVIINLVTNALKHTPRGGQVVVHTLRRANTAKVIVQDSGCGIPEEYLTRVFDRFYQVNNDMTRISGGVGLGLAISKTIIESHGGSIGASSVTGEGSSFWFEIPRGTKHE